MSRTKTITAAGPLRSARAIPSLLLALYVSAVCSQSDARPNILLVLTDNQGYFELGCKGHPYLETPHIDAFARESVDFCNFHAENFCSPSRAALLTGRQPMRFGVHNTIGGVSLLAASEVTLADHLRKAGYKTAIFGKWHLGMSYPFHAMDRGFDEVFIHGGGGIGQLEDYADNDHMDAHFEHNGTWVPSEGFSTDVLFDRAAQFIESCGEEPFFCYVPTPATHFPVQAEPVALARIQQRGVTSDQANLSLLSMIENIDDNVGRILAKLDQWNLSSNTLVIFMADQGVGDRGSPEPVWAGSNRPDLRNAAEGKHRVFCMMRLPGVTVAGENQALACIRDICPTILEICGVDLPENLDGRSLTPLLRGDKNWQDGRTLVIQCPRARTRSKWEHAVVKQGNWRLVKGGRLYDISSDSRQEHDVAAEHADIVTRLTKVYDEFWNSLPPEEELINRHILGAARHPTTQLCAMDWYEGDAPWTQGAMNNQRRQGVWAVEVAQGGRYRFALRRTQQETPRPIGATSARIQVGPAESTTPLAREESVAILELDLQQGPCDLQTWLQAADNKDETWGAYFVDVEYLSGS